MEAVGLLIAAAWIGYVAGRIGPSPLAPWEVAMRRRTFEWRLWTIDEHLRKVEERRAALVAWRGLEPK